jgi:diaminopimelate decarboxylase
MARADLDIAVRNGRLAVEGCDATDLAERFGTPLYVVSAGTLHQNVARFTEAWSSAWREGPFQLLPALKGQNILAVWRLLAAEGVGCDVFGHHELEIALRGGIPPALISLNGSKRPAHIAAAVAHGVRITVDHVDELGEIRDAAAAAGRVAHVRIRIRPDRTAFTAPSDFVGDEVPIGIATQVYKPGVPLADLLAIDPRELAPHVDLAGVHQHAARHSATLEFWEAIAAATVETIKSLHDGWNGWLPREIDLGGGFPSSLDGVGGQIERVARARDARSVAEYAAATTGALRSAAASHGLPLRGVLLEIEPGRALFADTGIHLARVTRVKRQAEPMAWAWVEVDTADVFLSDVITEHTRFKAVVADRADEPPVQHADVVGCSCNWDQLIEQEALPEVATGDVIAFLGTGCYEEVSAANFNALPRPGTVLVQGSDAAVVRRAETLADVLSRDL